MTIQEKLHEIADLVAIKDIGYDRYIHAHTEYSGDRKCIHLLLAVISKLIEQRDGWLETDFKGDEIHKAEDDAELLAILEGK